MDIYKELSKRQQDVIIRLKKEIEQLKNELIELQVTKIYKRKKNNEKNIS